MLKWDLEVLKWELEVVEMGFDSEVAESGSHEEDAELNTLVVG